MPPKKATATKAKATPATTAASERPRRAAAMDAPAAAPTKKAAAKSATASATPATKKRGRPAKTDTADVDEEPPKKRGRPAKAAAQTATTSDAPKTRGRPAKNAPPVEDEPAVPGAETAPPKRRGRPPKGGETTKIAEDDPAAAEQLEEELVDAAEAEENEAPSKRAPPAKKGKAAGKGKGRKPQPVPEEDQVDAADAVEDAADSAVNGQELETGDEEAATGKSFWLMKAEQIDREETLPDGSVFNSKFTIDDLRSKAGPEPWDGVRNPTACKNMREMRVGDLAFFYASGAKGKALQPGITGIMQVVKEHEPDLSAFDETSPYYVEKASNRGTKDKPKWYLVHVEFRKKLSKPVGLKELRQFSRDSGVLANMQEFKAARLSVSKVTEKEWNFIIDNLIEGYEEDVEPAASTAEEKMVADLPAIPTGAATKVKVTTINGGGEEDQALPTSETAVASVEVNATSRAGSLTASRAPSRAASGAPSRAASRAASKAPSRQASLAPPRAQSRGRSRTPAVRAGSVKPMPGVAEGMDTVQE